MNNYIPSDKITIFPSSSRTTTSGKYGNNFLTEHTVANNIRQLIDGNGFIITTEQNSGWLNSPFIFNIYGYFVQVDQAADILTYATTSVLSDEVESFVTFQLRDDNIIYAEIALDNIANNSTDVVDTSFDYLVGMEGIKNTVDTYEDSVANRSNTISLPILNVDNDNNISIYQDSFLKFVKLENINIDESIKAAHNTFSVADDDVTVSGMDDNGNTYKIELSKDVISVHTTTEEGTTLFKANSENGIIFIGDKNAYTKIEKNNITSISIDEEDGVTNKFTVTDGNVATTESITANKDLYIDGKVAINKTEDDYGVTITKIEDTDTSGSVTDTYSELYIDNITKIANGVITNGTKDKEGSIINEGDFTNELGANFVVKKTYLNEVTDDNGNKETVEDIQHFTIHEVTVDGKTYLQIDTNLPIIVGTEDKYTEIKDGTIYNTNTIDNDGKVTVGNKTDEQTIINKGGITIDDKVEVSKYTSGDDPAYRITINSIDKADDGRISGRITVSNDTDSTQKTIITDDSIEVDNISTGDVSTGDIVASNSLKAGDQGSDKYTLNVDNTGSITINGAKFIVDANGNVTIYGTLSSSDNNFRIDASHNITTSGTITTTGGLSKSLTITLNGNPVTYDGSNNADKSVSFYAPPGGGDSTDQYLRSNGGSNAPEWQTPAGSAAATALFNDIFGFAAY